MTTVGSKPTKLRYKSKDEEEKSKIRHNMAAAVSSVWAKPGAWALAAEEHDEEVRNQQEEGPPPQTQIADSSAFPSLADAATTKSKKKKKGQTMALSEFATYKAPTREPEIVQLPTGPRERSAEELERPGGFRSDNKRWGPRGGSEEGERRSSFNKVERDSGPSRADEDDNWAVTKKPSFGFERRDRGFGFDSDKSLTSKADEVDSWVSSKTDTSRYYPASASVGAGGDRFEKRGSFESLSRNRDSDSGSWGRRREESDAPVPSSAVSRPKLVLQKRTLPAPVLEVRPGSPVKVVESPVVVVERPKGANPFGNARPREEVLAEKGQDWKEIEEKLEAVKLKEVAAVVEKAEERSPGKMGFGRKDDRTEGSWRKRLFP